MAKFPAMDYTMSLGESSQTTGQKIDRHKLLTFVNIGDPYGSTEVGAAPNYVPLGKGVEDSSLEFDMDVNTVHDILGNTVTTVGGFTITQTFDPCYAEVGSELHRRMNEILAKKEYSAFSLFDVVVVKLFWVKDLSSTSTPDVWAVAELHRNCDVHPQSMGGQDYVNMPLSVTLSDDKVLGWAKYNTTTKVLTFGAAETDDMPA